MDLLKKYFPYSFGAADIVSLVIKILVYIIAGVLIGLVCKVISLVPFIGPIIAWVVGTVLEIYVLAGIVIAVLDYLKVLK